MQNEEPIEVKLSKNVRIPDHPKAKRGAVSKGTKVTLKRPQALRFISLGWAERVDGKKSSGPMTSSSASGAIAEK